MSELARQLEDYTEEELFEVLKQAWANIPRRYIESLIESMPRRCQAVIDANGYATKY